MAVEIVMPRLGWTMEEGTLVEWSKGHGEEIAAGEIVMLIESDKAVNEVEVFDGGIIHIPADSPPVGIAVPVGTVMAYILEPGEALPAPGSAAAAPTPDPATPSTADATSALTATPSTASASVEQRRRPVQPIAARRRGRQGPTISPRARRVAIELGVDWKSLRGSGLTGRIVERGPVEAVYADPRNAYTFGLLRSLPQGASGQTRLLQIDGAPPSLRELPPGDPFAPRNPYATERCLLEVPPLDQVADGAAGHMVAAWYDLKQSLADGGST